MHIKLQKCEISGSIWAHTLGRAQFGSLHESIMCRLRVDRLTRLGHPLIINPYMDTLQNDNSGNQKFGFWKLPAAHGEGDGG